MKPVVVADRKKVRPQAAAAVGGKPQDTSDAGSYAGDVLSDPDKRARSGPITALDVVSGKHGARGV
jgi:hypothetical protein